MKKKITLVLQILLCAILGGITTLVTMYLASIALVFIIFVIVPTIEMKVDDVRSTRASDKAVSQIQPLVINGEEYDVDSIYFWLQNATILTREDGTEVYAYSTHPDHALHGRLDSFDRDYKIQAEELATIDEIIGILNNMNVSFRYTEYTSEGGIPCHVNWIYGYVYGDKDDCFPTMEFYENIYLEMQFSCHGQYGVAMVTLGVHYPEDSEEYALSQQLKELLKGSRNEEVSGALLIQETNGVYGGW